MQYVFLTCQQIVYKIEVSRYQIGKSNSKCHKNIEINLSLVFESKVSMCRSYSRDLDFLSTSKLLMSLISFDVLKRREQ